MRRRIMVMLIRSTSTNPSRDPRTFTSLEGSLILRKLNPCTPKEMPEAKAVEKNDHETGHNKQKHLADESDLFLI